MTRPSAAIACIGAAHIDRLARAARPVVLASSNPVSVSQSLGGVARNVAESLARLDCAVALVSRIGSDPDGDRVMSAMRAMGVDMTGTTRSAARPTASYTALVGPDGEMTVALADMAIYDELTPDSLHDVLGRPNDPACRFADCNLPGDTLAFLRRTKPPETTLAIDAVSVAKAERLGADLSGIDTVFCNHAEARVLAGAAGSPEECAAAIRRRGAAAAIVSLGADGALIADAAGSRTLPALPARVRDVTGAGDALIAGTLFGIAGGRSPRDSLPYGLAAAALAVESDTAAPSTLSADALRQRAASG